MYEFYSSESLIGGSGSSLSRKSNTITILSNTIAISQYKINTKEVLNRLPQHKEWGCASVLYMSGVIIRSISSMYWILPFYEYWLYWLTPCYSLLLSPQEEQNRKRIVLALCITYGHYTWLIKVSVTLQCLAWSCELVVFLPWKKISA